MAVAYRSIATINLASRTNTTITKPSGTAENDILRAYINIGDVSITPPSGWALVTTVDHDTQDLNQKVYWLRAGASEPADYTWTHSSAFSAGAIVAISGAPTSGDPLDATTGTDNNDTGTTVNIPSITTATDGSLIIAVSTEYNTGVTGTTPSGWDERADVDGVKVWTKTQTTAGATGATTSTLSAGVTAMVQAVEAVKPAPSYTLEQEGFRFGEDDGNEAAHTWTDAQDTNITTVADTAKLLRSLVNTTLDTPSSAYTLRSQKNGSGGYVAVPVGATTIGATPVIETADATESGNNTASGSWDLSTPNASTGDLLIFCLSWDDSTTTTDVTEPAGKQSETLLEINATPATDAGTETRCKVWYCIAAGSWTAGTITFTPSASEQWTGACIRVPAGEFDATTPIGASDTEGSAVDGSNVQHGAFTAGASDGSGKLCIWTSADTDPQTVAANYTQVCNTDRGAVSGGFFHRNAAVTNSESISAGTVSTIASDSWCTVAFVVRAPIITNDVYVVASSNVTAGGEATTARLSAPSGKTTSDFTTGRRWDDENGSDSTDIASGFYSEFEWSLKVRSGLSDGTYFDFRVYAGANNLNTYTVTPRWTINSVTTIVLDTATVTAAGIALSLVPGAVTTLLDTAALLANGITLTVTNLNIILLDTATLSAGGQSLTLVPGAVSMALDTALLTANGQAFTVVPGAYSITLDTAILTANGQTIAVGNINIILLDTAALIAGGQALTLVPGAVSTALDTALISVNGQAFTVVPGAVTKALTTALLSANGQALTLSLGAVSTLLDTALLTATGRSATLVPGAVTTLLDTALITANGIAITLQVSGGSVTVILDTATLLAGGVVLDVVPGDISTLLDTAALVANGQAVTIVPGGVIIGLDTASLLASGRNIIIDTLALAIIRAWTLRDRNTSFTLADRDIAWSLRNRDKDWSLNDRDKDWSLHDRESSWNVEDR